MVAAIILSYLGSLPLVANSLAAAWQHPIPLDSARLAAFRPQVIVVLAGGLYSQAPEYPGDTINLRTLGRIRYGAILARRTQLPLLVSGGGRYETDDYRGRYTEAELMAEVLQQELGIKQVWLETTSNTTRTNAQHSAALLQERGLERILLVTNAAHMPRSLAAFRRAGLTPLAAPTLFFSSTPEPLEIESWLPAASALYQIHYFSHEIVGSLWYALRD